MHLSDTEETLEVTSLDDDDLNFISLYCYECGASTVAEQSVTPEEARALMEAREGIAAAVTEAFVMTPLR